MKDTIETTKVCNKCGEDKPLSEYHKQKQKKDGHHPTCKVCRKAANKAYYEANREKLAASDKAYYEANRERINAQKKAHYEANRERIIAERKAYSEANREGISAWKKAHHAEKWANDPEYRARYYANTRRRQRLLASAIQEPYSREDIFERDNWTCQLCQEPIVPALKWPDRWAASIDHVTPISHGGDDTPANVQAAHLTCNQSKGNRVKLEDLQAA